MIRLILKVLTFIFHWKPAFLSFRAHIELERLTNRKVQTFILLLKHYSFSRKMKIRKEFNFFLKSKRSSKKWDHSPPVSTFDRHLNGYFYRPDQIRLLPRCFLLKCLSQLRSFQNSQGLKIIGFVTSYRLTVGFVLIKPWKTLSRGSSTSTYFTF